MITNIILDSPLKNLFKPQFYEHKDWMDDTKTILDKVPNSASVAAQNNLLPHLSHRREVYILPNVNNAEYIVMDLHEGQDNWNFYTEGLEETKSLMTQLIRNNSYKVIISSGDVYLLKNFDKNI